MAYKIRRWERFLFFRNVDLQMLYWILVHETPRK